MMSQRCYVVQVDDNGSLPWYQRNTMASLPSHVLCSQDRTSPGNWEGNGKWVSTENKVSRQGLEAAQIRKRVSWKLRRGEAGCSQWRH